MFVSLSHYNSIAYSNCSMRAKVFIQNIEFSDKAIVNHDAAQIFYSNIVHLDLMFVYII